ncbi:MAG: thiamine diphosphokinase, partial [Chloroflexi bacterium]|nr:thiamine diphosphokinase [Chloroflexota bacterium]
MRCVVVAAGDVDPRDRALLEGASPVIAADAGALALLAWGIRPDHLIGDLDSLDGETVERLRQQGTAVHQRAREKDESDTELAVELALSFAPTRLVILGALGGSRIDHELASVLLLADPRLRGHDVRIVRGAATLRALHAPGTLTLEAPPGSTVTLLPVGGDASGVTTRG